MTSEIPRANLIIMLNVTGVLIVALVLAIEYYLRANDARRSVRATTIPGLNYEPVPSYRRTYKGVEYRTNKFGFRGADFPMRKPAGEYRISMRTAHAAIAQAIFEYMQPIRTTPTR